jgi:carbamoyl-phosphate synthase small subunit
VKGFVALEDGALFEGESFGAPGEAIGEVVFNTGMSGYQEVLTDPSYASQIVTMTYPLIGNYGINARSVESDRIQVQGFVVKEACRYPSNFTSEKTLQQYLVESGIVGVEGVDTRALTRRIRVKGAMKGAVCAGDSNPKELIEKARAWAGLVNVDTVKNVTCRKSYVWNNEGEKVPGRTERFSIVAFDYGIKRNILRILYALGCRITVVPASTTAAQALALKPDGIFLSNGPGDPSAVTYAIENLRALIGELPVFGICLGHQLLALALGGKTYKLKFGHRGANHPVRNIETGQIEITSQNHGFCVDLESLKNQGIAVTHINLNDHTCEGMDNPAKRVFSVQYHPEASPGPHDSGYLFEKFIGMMGG